MGMLLTYHEGYRADEPESEAKPLDRQNKAELQETARTLGVSDEGTKAELLDRIKAKQSEGDEPDEDPEDAPDEDAPEGSEDESPED